MIIIFCLVYVSVFQHMCIQLYLFFLCYLFYVFFFMNYLYAFHVKYVIMMTLANN